MTEQTDVYEEVFERTQERVVTDEMLAKARQRIGVPLKVHTPFNEYVTVDAIRHFAHGTGDDNPLHCDPDYAATTRWQGMIAPPLFYRSTGLAEKKVWTREERQMARDPLSGIHSWYAGENIHWLAPVRPGDQFFVRRFLQDCIEKTSSFAGRTLLEIQRSEYRNQHGELAVVSDELTIRGGREKNRGERKKYSSYERPTYSSEDIKCIDESYETENRRGAATRHWEDVEIGEELPTLVKGPITITDMINWSAGIGLAMQYHGAHRLAYQWRKAHPRAYVPNPHGVPDMIESVHWDDDMARRTGNPYAYDYGEQRIAWLTHLITDWMGDDAWLCSMKSQVRRFVYVGDTIWLKGRVVGKYEKDTQYFVEVEVNAEDHRGEPTAPGTAIVMLPSNASGPIKLPPKLDMDYS